MDSLTFRTNAKTPLPPAGVPNRRAAPRPAIDGVADWLIQEHVVAGTPDLPEVKKARVSSSSQESVIKQ